jgi:phosphatidylglycerol:prolipoprotein diacylglycerol transferase
MSTLAYYVHNLNPMIFELGPIKPRWYGFAYLMGFLGAYLLVKKLSRDGMLRLHPDRVPDLVLNCCIFGVLLGGRLGYVLFYDLGASLHAGHTPLLWDFSTSFPFWGVFRVWDGGMSAHGGVLFTIVTLAWFAWRHKVSLVNIGDAACMVVPIGLCFGRIANFINGELYGHPTTVPWAVQFPTEIYAPTNNSILPSVKAALPGVMAKLFGPEFALPDLFDEGYRMLASRLAHHQADAVQAVAAILPPRHPSQLYESLLEGVLLFAICWTVGRVWRKDGMASGAFLTLYPVMRIIGEQFRVGDSPRKVLGVDMSLGVLYSLLMFLGGALYWAYWIHRDRRTPWIPPQPAAAGPAAAPAPPAAPAPGERPV